MTILGDIDRMPDSACARFVYVVRRVSGKLLLAAPLTAGPFLLAGSRRLLA